MIPSYFRLFGVFRGLPNLAESVAENSTCLQRVLKLKNSQSGERILASVGFLSV